MAISSFKELIVWQKSFELAKVVYTMTRSLPRHEQFGLISQMQRAAVSIPSNIAEGQQRNSVKEYRQFLGIAKGSSAELETQLLLVKLIYDLDTAKELATLHEIQKMLRSLHIRLEPRT